MSRPADLALLPYSSGTTGLPKGVMLTHVQLVTAMRQVHAAIRPGPTDTMLAVAPFFHALGFAVTLAGAWRPARPWSPWPASTSSACSR